MSRDDYSKWWHSAVYGETREERLLALTLLRRAWESEQQELARLRGRCAALERSTRRARPTLVRPEDGR